MRGWPRRTFRGSCVMERPPRVSWKYDRVKAFALSSSPDRHEAGTRGGKDVNRTVELWGRGPVMPRKPVDIRRAEWIYRGNDDGCAFSWGGMISPARFGVNGVG